MFNKDMFDVIAKCHQNKGYRVVIVTRNVHTAATNFIETAYGADCIITRYQLMATAAFTNGSLVSILKPTENARGHKTNLLLYDDTADEEILNVVFKPMLIKYNDINPICKKMEEL